jgi:ATP-binding cassette subfamily B protein
VTLAPDNSEATDTRRVLPRLVAMMPDSKYWRLPVFCLALAGGAGASVVAPFLAGRFLFDEVLSPQGRFAGMVLLAVGLILLARLAEVGFRITWGWVNAAFIHDLEITLKRTAFASLQRLSMRFHTARHSGELMTRLEQDASDVTLLFHIIAPSALHGGIFLAGSLTAMLLLDWQLAIAAILPFPVLLIAFRRILPQVNSFFDRLFEAEAELRTVATDSVTGARVVRAFGGQQRELARFAAPNREAARLGFLAEAMTGTTRPPMELVTELVLVGVWAAGAWAVARDQVTVGLVITFAGYLSRFFWPVGGLVDLAENWGRVATAARRLLALIDARPDLPEPPRPRRIDGVRGGLALERVSFSYEPGQPVLQEVNLHAASGEMIGLVGPTGAGKSTVINLLARLYDADAGVVRVAGQDVRELAGTELAAQLGVVLQDTYLFIGSVAANIGYARPHATREQIIAAAVAADAHQFILELPDGYDTELSAGGQGLSGGQRQRLGIARALLADPPILLMDEATASVDTETEVRIQGAIERLVHGRTVVVIAHRLSTLRRAARLYALDGGRVVESGAHDELMRADGYYRRLVQRQREALHVIGVGE